MNLIGWSCDVQGNNGQFAGKKYNFEISAGLVIMVGPNGTGKSRVLKDIADQIRNLGQNLEVRYLSAGRAAPLEKYRHRETGSHSNPKSAEVGSKDWIYKGSETITGDILRLMEKKDLLLKVQCRLEQLLGRKVLLEWSQSGIGVSFASKFSNEMYSAVGEATGLIQLLCLMAALYDDETSVLVIDEPETGLHPQLQAFLLNEMLNVSGDPLLDQSKKLIIIATHSPSMMWIPKTTNFSAVYFFNKYDEVPSRLGSENVILRKIDQKGLLARLSEASKFAFFAHTVILVEGPSDRIISHAVARQLKTPLAIGGVEVVPVTGNGELPITVELFDAIGKKVIIVTDLDTIVDGSDLVDCLRRTTAADKTATQQGHASFKTLYKSVRDDLLLTIDNRWSEISALAEQHPYWTQRDKGTDKSEELQKKLEKTAKRRAASGCLLSACMSEIATLSAEWSAIRDRLIFVLNLLESAGCFVLRRGVIEDYYKENIGSRKPAAAVEEADFIGSMESANVKLQYPEISRALEVACLTPIVDEVSALRAVIASCASKILMQMTESTDGEEMSRMVADDGYSKMLSFENASSGKSLAISVRMVSRLFKVSGLPVIISKSDTLDYLERRIKALP